MSVFVVETAPKTLTESKFTEAGYLRSLRDNIRALPIIRNRKVIGTVQSDILFRLIQTKCNIRGKMNFTTKLIPRMKCYSIDTDSLPTVIISLPAGLFSYKLDSLNTDLIWTFKLELLDRNKEIISEVTSKLITNGTLLISLPCGYGKTCIAIYLSCILGLRTLVVCHREILVDQWIAAIEKFTELTPIKVNTDTEVTINGVYVGMMMKTSRVNKNELKKFDVLIVDEAHLVAPESMNVILKLVSPKYSIALSATPDRPDGLDILNVYYKERIIRTLNRKFEVHVIRTGIIPPIIQQSNSGMLDWTNLITGLSECEEKNKLIAGLCMKYVPRKILVWCKRKQQCIDIVKYLEELGETNWSIVKANTSKTVEHYDKTKRVILGCIGKTSTGIDDPEISVGIFASDVVNYVEQYVGRVLRNLEYTPIIVDIIDSHKTLEKHYLERSRYYSSQELCEIVENEV